MRIDLLKELHIRRLLPVLCVLLVPSDRYAEYEETNADLVLATGDLRRDAVRLPSFYLTE